MRHLSATELAEWLATTPVAGEPRLRPLLLDVREPWEYELCHLPGSLSIPMQFIPSRLAELDAQAEIVLICHHGVRSRQVATFLERQGFGSLHNLTGGVDAWAREVDPAMHKY